MQLWPRSSTATWLPRSTKLRGVLSSSVCTQIDAFKLCGNYLRREDKKKIDPKCWQGNEMGCRLTKEMCTMHNSCSSTIIIQPWRRKNCPKLQAWRCGCRQTGMGGKEHWGLGRAKCMVSNARSSSFPDSPLSSLSLCMLMQTAVVH